MVANDPTALARANRRLALKLERSTQKLRVLEALQAQTATAMRNLMSDLEVERARSERLLRSMLPAAIADRLRDGERVIAERFESASVLFADVVGFTGLAQRLGPRALVDWLDRTWSWFDARARAHGLEKIRTIGDAYMVASGVPHPRPDHAVAITRFALDVLDGCGAEAVPGCPVEVRVGIHAGPLVAGVIGRDKPQYDVWGDTVNVASRLESHGRPGRIHVSRAFRDLVAEHFTCTPRGAVELKGKGRMETWFVDRSGPLDAYPQGA